MQGLLQSDNFRRFCLVIGINCDGMPRNPRRIVNILAKNGEAVLSPLKEAECTKQFRIVLLFGSAIGHKDGAKWRKSTDLVIFDDFSNNSSSFRNRFADDFFRKSFRWNCAADENSPDARSKQMVCPDPGFYQVRDKEVQSGSVIFKGNFVPDERKLVGT